MTRPSPASSLDDLVDEIASLLEPGQREPFYRCMLSFKHLRPEDELLRLVQAIGFLALLIRDAPVAVARERVQLAQLLETSLATIQAAWEAERAYLQQLDDRLTGLPTDLAQRISPEAIARAITESLRQQFVQSGLPATADALTALSQQLAQATGPLQRAAAQLHACTGIANQAHVALDQVRASVAKVTDAAEGTIAELRQHVSVEYVRGVGLLCCAAWLFGVFGGMAFERWRDAEGAVLPQAIAVPAQVAAPSPSSSSSAAEVTSEKPAPAPARDRHREPHKPTPHGEDAKRPLMEQSWNRARTVMEQRRVRARLSRRLRDGVAL
jgi:hypothetical protein